MRLKTARDKNNWFTSFEANFLSWQKSLPSSPLIIVDYVSLLSSLQLVLTAFQKSSTNLLLPESKCHVDN